MRLRKGRAVAGWRLGGPLRLRVAEFHEMKPRGGLRERPDGLKTTHFASISLIFSAIFVDFPGFSYVFGPTSAGVGGRRRRWHYDVGSLVTVDVLLQAADRGGRFRSYEAGRWRRRRFQNGDALVFLGHQRHGARLYQWTCKFTVNYSMITLL